MSYMIVNVKFNDKVLTLSLDDNNTVLGLNPTGQSNQVWSIREYNGLSVIKNVGSNSAFYLGEQKGKIIGIGSDVEDQAPKWDIWREGRYSRILLGNLFLEIRRKSVDKLISKELGFAPGEYDDDAQLWELVPGAPYFQA